MKYCKACNVSVNTDSQKCPLCSLVLAPVKEADVDGSGMAGPMDNGCKNGSQYPFFETVKVRRYHFLFRLFLFLSVAAGSTSLLVNILTYSGVLWSLMVLGTILFLWITVAYPIYQKKNIGYIIIIHTISVCVFISIIEAVTCTQGWGLDFAIPFLLVTATLAITLIIILKRLKWREYSVYQITMVLLGFLPVILCISGLIKTIWPSVLSAFYSFLTFTGMLIFADKKYENELIKRFHL